MWGESFGQTLHVLNREAITHAATPWEWRTRTPVIWLVIACAALFVAGVVLAAQRSAASAILNGVILGLLFLLPSVRSLRRWDDAHRSRVP